MGKGLADILPPTVEAVKAVEMMRAQVVSQVSGDGIELPINTKVRSSSLSA